MSETAPTTTSITSASAPPISYLEAAVKALVECCSVQMSLSLESDWQPYGAGAIDHMHGAAIDLGTAGGAWRMYVFCPDGTAASLARIMFDLPPDEDPEAEDMEDCLCEVVNISAGYLKSLNDELASFELRLPGFLVPEERPNDLGLHTEERARRLCSGEDIELLTTFVWHEES
ncbi:MAG: chemotaxis protein CheX [bacterium]|nr:chemotaxis protein CheX [bacterium]